MWIYCSDLVPLPDEWLCLIRECRDVVPDALSWDMVLGGCCDDTAETEGCVLHRRNNQLEV